MRYADLTFSLHGYMPAAEAAELERRLLAPSDRTTPVVIEHAAAPLPNGRYVSVLRGMLSAGAAADFETCRMFDYADGLQPIKHTTIESVDAELAAVASLPPL